jgi:hypothetical protein
VNAIVALLKRIVQALSGAWKPAAVPLCGLVIVLCWPTLQAAAQVLARDVLNYDQETDPFTRFVATWTHHALLLSLAALCLIIVIGAIWVLVMIIYTEIRLQRRKQRDYDHRSAQRKAEKHASKPPSTVIPIDRKRINA